MFNLPQAPQFVQLDVPQKASPDFDGNSSPLPLLPRYLAFAYVALIIYASLHPFSGWRDPGLSPFLFLTAPWPRYWTLFDLLSNVLAYAPLGFLLAQSMMSRTGRLGALLLSTIAGIALSFSIESAQSFLPSRVPSNVDLLCNSLGSLSGALVAMICGNFLLQQFLTKRWHRIPLIRQAEYGLVLVGLWWLAQLSPETFLFGTGDLRHMVDFPPTLSYDAPSYFAMETGVIVCNTLTIGLFISTLLTERRLTPSLLIWFFFIALLIRTLAMTILVGPQSALAWLTPGAGLGILIGAAALALLLLLPSPLRVALAVIFLMAGTALINLAPFNPYSVAALAAWRQGHFLNFNGLTRLAASFWPFLALPYLILLVRRR